MATLIEQLTPRVLASLADDKEAIIAGSGSLVDRLAIRAGWKIAMDLAPTVFDRMYAAMLEKFGSMPMSDLVNVFADDLRTIRARSGGDHAAPVSRADEIRARLADTPSLPRGEDPSS